MTSHIHISTQQIQASPVALTLHGLLTTAGLTVQFVRQCLAVLSLDQLLQMTQDELAAVGMTTPHIQRWCRARDIISNTLVLQQLQTQSKHSPFWILSCLDEHYPKTLHELPDYPLLLYGRGDPLLLQASRVVAVVGSRNPTHYGTQIVQRMVADLVRGGIVVVSGLAYGIDQQAHRATLKHGGYTIAVLGGSIMSKDITPRVHEALADEIIAQGGTVVSEYPPGTLSLTHHFPQRNRIIAGLSQATVVIEAAIKSGSLITARLANEYNREVLAVPGSILSPLSAGTNHLIAAGAKPWLSCQSLYDALEYWQTYPVTKPSVLPTNLTIIETLVLGQLSSEPQNIEDIADAVEQPVHAVMSAITQLSLKGLAADVGSGTIIKI